jgi:hypothetical protein
MGLRRVRQPNREKLYSWGVIVKNASIVAIGVILLTFSAAQAETSWSSPGGSADYFDWQNGQSLNGLFGDPMLSGGDTFVFFPSHFRADSLDGLDSSVYDRLEFELIAHPGFSFKNFNFSEFGDYGISDDGSVNVLSSLSIENLDTLQVLNSNFALNPLMPISSGQDIWSAEAQLAINSADWTHIKITLDNELLASSQPGSVSFIEKKILSSGITMQPIPEPATITILCFGAAFMLRDFRNNKSDV